MLCLIIAAAASTQAIACGISYQSTSSLEYLIDGCLFRSLSGSTYGGAIYIYSGTSSLSAKSSIFDVCTATTDGGAIYCYNQNLYMHAVCALNCQATTYEGQFCFSLLSTSGTGILIELSYCRCPISTNNGPYVPFWMQGGIYQNATFLNSSANKVALWGSSQLFYAVTYASAAYTNHFNNTALEYIGVYFAVVTSGIITKSNLISNNVVGIISFGEQSAQVSVTSCVFKGNTGDPLFYVYSYSGSYIASNCWISHNGTICGSGVQTSNCFTTIANAFNFGSSLLVVSGDSCTVYISSGITSAQFSSICRRILPSLQMVTANVMLLGIEF